MPDDRSNVIRLNLPFHSNVRSPRLIRMQTNVDFGLDDGCKEAFVARSRQRTRVIEIERVPIRLPVVFRFVPFV